MPVLQKRLMGLLPLAVLTLASVYQGLALAQEESKPPQSAPNAKSHPPKQSAQTKQPTPDEELRQTIEAAGNDRVALVHNLESFLKKYPEAQQRVQIYRALVEASLQLRDNTRAADYAERIVALSPDDMSMTMLTIQLLERDDDEAALRRAKNYATRVLNFIDRGANAQKSPKISKEDWEAEQKRERMTLLLLRGRLYQKLHELPKAQSDFEDSYELVPNAAAAEKLGEIAELNQDLPLAIKHYAHAFALADAANGASGRREIRQKLGNVWRRAHSSDEGLGDFILHTYDEVSVSAVNSQSRRNVDAKEPFDFTLRRAPDHAPFPLAAQKGKILVVNFWATWCGPCRALEPLFERVALNFQQNQEVLFLAADCDEDETLVPPYLQEVKPKTTVVFADGLDRLFAVNSFPTVVVIDKTGKIVYRAEGYGEDSFEESLTTAVRQTLSSSAKLSSLSPNR
jgi:thiol-disulfide isomerase/thioredoxin